jgi:hypothetical protein
MKQMRDEWYSGYQSGVRDTIKDTGKVAWMLMNMVDKGLKHDKKGIVKNSFLSMWENLCKCEQKNVKG